MSTRISRATLGSLVLGTACALAAGGAQAGGSAATPLRAADCSQIQNPAGSLLLVSDLPLHGPSRGQALQMTKAIAFELSRRGWHAGAYTVAYQSCDDSSVQAGDWDPATCSANAARDGADASIVGVIGTLDSGCAELELPLTNRAPNGPLAMVSPSDTYPGLTHAAPGTSPAEPATYYPTGKRSFARVIAADDAEAAADATLARRLDVTRLFVLHDRQAYGEGIAADLAAAAKKLGISVVASVRWDPQASSYAKLAARIAHSGAQAVFLGGLASENGGRLIAGIRAGDPSLTLIAPDGFTPVPALVEAAGGAANGLYVSLPGLPDDRLPPAGQAFVSAFTQAEDGAAVDPYAVYAAEATDVLLAAIASSNGTRAGVAAQLAAVRIRGGLLGAISFDADGDLTAAPVTIYRIVSGAATTDEVIVPKSSLLTPG